MERYSPYCKVCGGCGESGCCSPTMCDPTNPECDYSYTYIEDLKLSYATLDRFWDLLSKNDWFGKKSEFMKIYEEELDKRFPDEAE